MEQRPPTIQTSQFYVGNQMFNQGNSSVQTTALQSHLNKMVTRTKKNLETGMPLGNVSSLSLVGPGSFTNV